MFVASPPPKTLNKVEQSRLLRTVARSGSPRDLALLSALGTGLRLRETLATSAIVSEGCAFRKYRQRCRA
jgi:hypothetical protein